MQTRNVRLIAMVGLAFGSALAPLPAQQAISVAASRESSQQTAAKSGLQSTVSITVTNTKLSDVLAQLARSSGVDIRYSGRVLPASRLVSLNMQNEPLEVALKAVLKGTSLETQVSP